MEYGYIDDLLEYCREQLKAAQHHEIITKLCALPTLFPVEIKINNIRYIYLLAAACKDQPDLDCIYEELNEIIESGGRLNACKVFDGKILKLMLTFKSIRALIDLSESVVLGNNEDRYVWYKNYSPEGYSTSRTERYNYYSTIGLPMFSAGGRPYISVIRDQHLWFEQIVKSSNLKKLYNCIYEMYMRSQTDDETTTENDNKNGSTNMENFMANPEKIGEIIRTLREEKGWTQAELAEKLFVQPKTISKWETGNGLPNLNTLVDISIIFNVTVNQLVGAESINKADKTNKPENENIKKETTNMEPVRQKYKKCPECNLNYILATESMCPDCQERHDKMYPQSALPTFINLPRRPDTPLLKSPIKQLHCGACYGTNSREIYERLCEGMNFDINQATKFGRQGTPLYADYADTNRTRAVWFISYVAPKTNNGHTNNILDGGDTIIEEVAPRVGPSVPIDRVTFVKNEKNEYAFLGVYTIVQNGLTRIHKRISLVYPF